MIRERRVKLLRERRGQTVRIPREFELPGENAVMRREGNRLIVEPEAARTLLEVLETLAPLDEEFPKVEDAAPKEVEI